MAEKFRVIELTKGFVAIISTEDFRKVNKHKWRVTHSKGNKRKHGAPYARGMVNGKDVYMHRFIMDCPDHLQTDHGNHCTLDNRRCNLENVTPTINRERKRKKKVG